MHLNQKLNHGKFLSKHCKAPSLKYDLSQELFNVEIAVQYLIKSITEVKAVELKMVFGVAFGTSKRQKRRWCFYFTGNFFFAGGNCPLDM